MLVENHQFEPNPPLFGTPVGEISLECRGYFWHHKESLRVWHCLCDPKFSHLCSTLTCDGQTDGQTHTHDGSNTALA